MLAFACCLCLVQDCRCEGMSESRACSALSPGAPASHRGARGGVCMVVVVIHHVEAMKVARLILAATRAYATVRASTVRDLSN